MGYAATSSLLHFGYSKKVQQAELSQYPTPLIKKEQRRRHVHVALYRYRGDVDGFGSHYNAVVNKKKNKGQLYMDLSLDHPPQGTYLLLSHHLVINQMTSIQLLRNSEMLPDFNSEPDASMFNLSAPDQHVLFPLEIFDGVEKEPVPKVPYNINGNHSYHN